jgi:hypothetical protein
MNRAQYNLVLHYTRLKRLVSDKHSSLLVTFLSYVKIVLGIHLLFLYSQLFIFFLTYEWAQYNLVLHYTTLEKLACDKQSSLLGPFVILKEYEVLLI